MSLDFDWPLDNLWKGYINPYPGPSQCTLCEGNGYNEATKQIADDFYDHAGADTQWKYDYGFAPNGEPATSPPWRVVEECRAWHDKITQDEVQALVDHHRLMEYTHVVHPKMGWVPKRWETKGFWCSKCHTAVPQLSVEHHTGYCTCTGVETETLLLNADDPRLYIPSAEEVNASQHRRGCLGHDSINRWILIEARARRLGVWGQCPKCKGKGERKLPRKMKKQYKKWKEFEPPIGEGYQLWETISEGSPISPVFATPEELAEWCTENRTTTGSPDWTYEEWLDMFTERKDLEAASLLVMQIPAEMQ